MPTKEKKSLEELVRDWVKEKILPEVGRLKVYSETAEIDSDCPLREGDIAGSSGVCVLVGISNHDGEEGDFLEGWDGWKKINPPGVPIGQYVAELVNDSVWGDRDLEAEEIRLSCIEEIRASLSRLEESIKKRMPED